MKADIDKVADSGAEGVVIKIPPSRRFIERAYGWTLEKAIALSVEATSYARERGLYTVFFPIDGSRAQFDDFMQIVTAVAKDGHMDALGCVDTMGVLSPSSISFAIRKMKQATGKPIEVHCHDDFGMGSANTLLTAVFQYSAIVFAAGFGLAFFDEPVGLMSAAGIAVILVSGVWAAVIAKKKS